MQLHYDRHHGAITPFFKQFYA